MDVYVVSIGIKVVVEDKRSVHEGARIDKTSLLMQFHSLDVEDKHTVEDLES